MAGMHYDIVIVGGGAGGLELAARLGRKLGRKAGKERVLLIDRSSFHIWKPHPARGGGRHAGLPRRRACPIRSWAAPTISASCWATWTPSTPSPSA